MASNSSPVVDGIVRGLTQAVVLVITILASVVLVGTLVFAIAFGLGAGAASATRRTAGTDDYLHVSGNRDSRNKLLTVRVEGPILGAPPKDRSTAFFLSGFTFGYEVQQVLEDAAKDDHVKGVLLHLQTPGGTIFGSRAIHDGVMAYRNQTKKPVVAYIEGLSASGGVMAMVGATRIYADHGSLVGSIGVLGPQLYYFDRPMATDGGLLSSGIVTEGGIEQTVIAAGRGKDLGNPFRRPTQEEIATLSRGIEAEYEQFVQHVARNRRMQPTTIRDQMGAMIFDNATAQSLGLIDGTATRGESLAKLAELAGVSKDYQAVRPADDDASMLRRLLSAAARLREPMAELRTQDVLRAELCSSVRAPLVYYGDPAAACR
jgi:protease-4